MLACAALVGCVPSGREWFDPPEGKTSFEKRQTISEFMEHTEPVFVEFIADVVRRNSGDELYYFRNEGFMQCEDGAGARLTPCSLVCVWMVMGILLSRRTFWRRRALCPRRSLLPTSTRR